MLYLLNSLVTPIKDKHAFFEIRQIDAEEAKRIVQSNPGFVSAIGHDITAKLMSLLLGTDVPVNRTSIYFNDIGDKAIAFVLSRRLPEGQVIRTLEELEASYTLYYIERVK